MPLTHILLDSHIHFESLQVAAYDTVAKKMAFFEPSRSQDFLFISGTKVSVSFSLRGEMLALWYQTGDTLPAANN